MKTIVLLILSSLYITGCNKTAVKDAGLNGKYAGTFERTTGMGARQKANVSLTFIDNNFSGTSDKPKFPAICNGTFAVNGDEINFINSCVWTADFDWSLILNNRYSLRVISDSIEIRREYPGQMTDTYRLKKDIE